MDRRLEHVLNASRLSHEEKEEEIRAGWVHFVFAILYAAACWWHFGAARQHWSNARSLPGSQLQLKDGEHIDFT